MTTRQSKIISVLQDWSNHGGATTSMIAGEVGCPEPSVRRSIQELIRLGHNISYARNGAYVYREGVN